MILDTKWGPLDLGVDVSQDAYDEPTRRRLVAAFEAGADCLIPKLRKVQAEAGDVIEHLVQTVKHGGQLQPRCALCARAVELAEELHAGYWVSP
jgi:hypothetical protein